MVRRGPRTGLAAVKTTGAADLQAARGCLQWAPPLPPPLPDGPGHQPAWSACR